MVLPKFGCERPVHALGMLLVNPVGRVEVLPGMRCHLRKSCSTACLCSGPGGRLCQNRVAIHSAW